MSTNTLWQQSEAVRTKKFPEWFEKKFNVFSDFVEKGEVEIVGERDYRVPIQLTFGGRFGHYDPQLGDMGRGSSPTGNVMLQSFFSVRLNFEFDMLQIKATTNKKVAVQNPFLQCIANGVRELQLLWDKCTHNDGTAALAYASAVSNASGVTVYTCAMPGTAGGASGFGTQLLRRGQYYTIYDSTLTTVKSAGLLSAAQINTAARTVAFSGIVPNAAANDIICFEGVSGASPAGPRGLKYWINQAQSGVTAGINRANEIQIVSKSVSGANGLTSEAVMALQDQIKLDRGEVGELMGLANPAQRAYAYSQMMSIQMALIEGDKANVYDRLPALKGKKFFMWGDVAHYEDIHQDSVTVPYFVASDFGRARLAPSGFYETPGKSGPDARFIQIYGASGGPAAAVWFGLTKDEDLYCINPGAAGVIYSLPLSTYYQ